MAIDASAFGYQTWIYEIDGYQFRVGEADGPREPYDTEYWVEDSLSDNCPVTVLEQLQKALELYNSSSTYAALPIKDFLAKVCGGAEAGRAPQAKGIVAR